MCWFFRFTLSIILLFQPSSIVLSYVDYNSKSSKLNRLISLFGRKSRLPSKLTPLANQMAELRVCHNPAPTGKDKLALEVLTKGKGTFAPTSVTFKASILTLAPGPPGRYIDENL